MWVYQQTAADQEFTGHPCPEVSMAPALGSAEPLRPELPDEGSPSQTRSSIQKSASRQISGQKNCWLLVCAFLLGSMAAGVIQAMCAAQPLDWTAHYFQAWSKLFAAAGQTAGRSTFRFPTRRTWQTGRSEPAPVQKTPAAEGSLPQKPM